MPYGEVLAYIANEEQKMAVQNKSAVSKEDYLENERKAETRSEYFQGEVVCLAGATARHNIIVTNIVRELGTQLKSRPCKVYASDMRLQAAKATVYTYPDVIVACGQNQFDDLQKDTLLNPTVIFEVLSDSTERIDRGKKFESYRQIESLQEYVLVSQNTFRVEHYGRKGIIQWLFSEISGFETVLKLESIACELPLREIYDKVDEF